MELIPERAQRRLEIEDEWSGVIAGRARNGFVLAGHLPQGDRLADDCTCLTEYFACVHISSIDIPKGSRGDQVGAHPRDVGCCPGRQAVLWVL